MIFDMIYVMGFAFALSLAVSGFMVSAGLGDIPDIRSNHKTTTPTSGGVGVIAGIGGMFLILPQFFPPVWISSDLPLILSILWAVGLLGLLDDLYTLPSLLKFAVLLGLSSLAVYIISPVQNLPFAGSAIFLPYWAGFAGSLLWVFAVTNAVNFMDGSNGLMPGVMSVACLGLVCVAVLFGAFQAMWLPAAIAAGLLGFLPYNMRRTAKIFSGDVGSLCAGFGFAISVLWVCAEAPSKLPVFIGPVLVLPFLADVLLTMLRRVKHRENLLKPHKSHLYQLLISNGVSHMQVAILYTLTGIGLAGLAYAMAMANYHQFTLFLTAPVAGLSAVYYVLVRRLKAS